MFKEPCFSSYELRKFYGILLMMEMFKLHVCSHGQNC